MSIIEELSSALKEATAEIASLKTTVHTLRIDKARVERETRLQASGLPPSAVARLHEAFATSTDNAGLKQAINVEQRGKR